MNYQSNPYSAPQTSYEAAAAYAADSERTGFIQRTYLHLAAAIFAFAGIECLFFTIGRPVIEQVVPSMVGGWTWLIFLGGFMVVSWVARSWAESNTSSQMQYAGLILYVVAEAILFVPLLYIANRVAGGGVIASAGVLTLIIFGGLTAIVFVTKADFSGLGRFLWWGGILAMAVMVGGLIFGFNLGLFFSVAMVGLASGYILYDTSNVMNHYRTDQHVAASLALFASVALLFWYVLRILIAFSGDD